MRQVGVEFNGIQASVNLAPERHAEKPAVVKRDLLPADSQFHVFVIKDYGSIAQIPGSLQASGVEDSGAIRPILCRDRGIAVVRRSRDNNGFALRENAKAMKRRRFVA